jgi:hypothetical protein
LTVREISTNRAVRVCDPDGRISHFQRCSFFTRLSVIIIHGFDIQMLAIVADMYAILIYSYLVLKPSLLIKEGFRRSRIVNIEG